MLVNQQVITLCGSTMFRQHYERVNRNLTLMGHVVFSCGVWGHSDPSITLTEEEKQRLDDIHKKKIALSDAIFVIDENDYIGESTRNEIEYAQEKQKAIYYLSQYRHLLQLVPKEPGYIESPNQALFKFLLENMHDIVSKISQADTIATNSLGMFRRLERSKNIMRIRRKETKAFTEWTVELEELLEKLKSQIETIQG